MAKRQEDAPVKTDGWKDTFSDLMNLLLCFFVLLFASSSVDAETFQKIAASFAQNFSILNGGQPGIQEGMLIASGASQLTELSVYYSELGKNEEGDNDEIKYAQLELEQEQLKESNSMAEDIVDKLNEANMSEKVQVQASRNYVMLTFKGQLLFESASADLKPESKELLVEVAEILKTFEGYQIEILGHTDNIPSNGKLFTSNDLLSAYRALSVFNELRDNGVSPNYMKHSGCGEYYPIADNDTEEGRAQNRRVEIKIYNSLSNVN